MILLFNFFIKNDIITTFIYIQQTGFFLENFKKKIEDSIFFFKEEPYFAQKGGYFAKNHKIGQNWSIRIF